MRVRISLVVICLNEEKTIEACLRSVPFADEIIVLDSGSTDQTVEIAKKCGAKVFVEAWRGFRDQKNRALELCSSEWVISLDADEALSPQLAQEIDQLLTSGQFDGCDGYEFPRLSYHLGQKIYHGGWYPDRQLRLFNRKAVQWQGGQHVHERVSATKMGRLSSDLLHWPFDNLAEQVSTNNRYSSLGADELLKKSKKFSAALLVLKPVSKFLECYVIKRGFLDGLAGFVIAVGASYSVFLKYAKLWEKSIPGSNPE
jgi:glycosyltransferase involved in cell wall biosynthesis